MKFSLLLLILLSSVKPVSAQNSETLIYRDYDGKKVKEKNATELLQIMRTDDTTWTYNYYDIRGPLKKSIQSNLPDGTVYHGEYYTYRHGYLDSVGFFEHGKKSGTWRILTSGGRLLKEIEYKDGKPVSELDSTQVNERRNLSIQNSGSKDSIHMKVEIESEFTGGQKAWADYLIHNLKYPARAIDFSVDGTVVVQFIVDKEGDVQNIRISRSVEYSLDKESLRIIRNSPQWKPAIQDGKPVKSYKRQPVMYQLTRK